MINEKQRRGPPKSDTPPLTNKERVKRYRDKLRSAGGTEILLSLDANDIAGLALARLRMNLPEHASHADIIKAMIVVIAGGTLISSSRRVSADLVTMDAAQDNAVSKRWPLCLPGTEARIALCSTSLPEERWKLTW